MPARRADMSSVQSLPTATACMRAVAMKKSPVTFKSNLTLIWNVLLEIVRVNQRQKKGGG